MKHSNIEYIQEKNESILANESLKEHIPSLLLDKTSWYPNQESQQIKYIHPTQHIHDRLTHFPNIQKKQRESIMSHIPIQTHKKRPMSISVMPTTSSSSSSMLIQQKKKNPISDRKRNRHFSIQPLSQYEKHKLSTLEHDEDNGTLGVHWDPHLDAFEILRAKITGITRSMQAFHVQELFQDEVLAEERRRRLSVFPSATHSTPLIHDNNKKNELQSNPRRMSLADTTDRRRIRSQGMFPIASQPPPVKEPVEDDHSSFHGFDQEKQFLHDFLNQNDTPFTSQDNDVLDDDRLLTSPNLTALFLTTNNLISSRLDELSETASLTSHPANDERHAQIEWQKQFLGLVTNCIQQSEALESLSTDLLNAEHRVRELMLINDTLNEQFQEREKQYEERIRECQEIAHQQLVMIDSLEELNADIDMKVETHRREMHRQEALRALDANAFLEDDQDDNTRWDFKRSVADILQMDEKLDIVQKMRWEIGMFVGGGVGTGHIIHTFEDKLNGIDMMIAGTGTTTTSPNDFQLSTYDDDTLENDEDEIQDQSVSISPSIQHIGLYQHNYIIHLSNIDRRTRFALLPKSLWVPDEATDQCQFQHNNRKKQCPTRFSFFNRRHHCRKCGLVICQRHGANRLPLFHPSKIHSTSGQWSRVCDTCFYDLIMQK